MGNKREHWGTQIGFILATAGSAVGLGNIWKFPYITGKNGGAAFVFIYIACIILIGLPIMLAEIVLGRRTQKNPVGAYRALEKPTHSFIHYHRHYANKEHPSKPYFPWFLAGGLGVLSGFIILSFYSVVAGWTLAYIIEAAAGTFTKFESVEAAGNYFGQFASTPLMPIIYHALFMFASIGIVIKGIQNGIERWNKILMPALFGILILLLIRGLTLPGAHEGIAFFLKPDFSLVTWKTVLAALGQAFFTLSLGMGAIMTYGSYLSKQENIPHATFMVVLFDTLVALIAGLAIFTSVFAMKLSPSAGPGLVFHTLPAVFNQMPGGYIFGILFFVLLFIAALTSSVSILETIVAYFVDEKNWTRGKAVLTVGAVIFITGIPASLSFGPLAEFKIAMGKNYFDFLDHLVSNYFLPLGGLLIALFVGWSWGVKPAIEEIRQGNPTFPTANIWSFMIRFICPLAVAIILFAKFIGIEF